MVVPCETPRPRCILCPIRRLNLITIQAGPRTVCLPVPGPPLGADEGPPPMNYEDRAKLHQVTAVAQAPVHRITIDLLPAGQITFNSTQNDPLRSLGLMEMAKAPLLRQATGEASPIVPATLVPQ